jgi:acyl dehydratase
MSTQESPAGAGLVTDVADLAAHVGEELGHTEWQEMTQERVNQFADVTDDHNFIHVDPERAKETVFGGTIAHGFLTLSMLAPISQRLLSVTGAKASINYGTDKVRFPAPLPVGSRVRMKARLANLEDVPGGAQMTLELTFERDGGDKPVCVAESLARVYPE